MNIAKQRRLRKRKKFTDGSNKLIVTLIIGKLKEYYFYNCNKKGMVQEST
jgi:hypothetical protein